LPRETNVTLRPDSDGQVEWSNGGIPVPGIEPGALGRWPKTLRPPLVWRIIDQLRPIEIQMDREAALCSLTEIWKLG
jgi:hypothetical protein